MDADVLVVGQGLAGSLIGWELERAGVRFAIADPGHAMAASAVAAGIVNPVTGRRLVKAWGVDDLLPRARQTYREIGDHLGLRLWHEVRIWRRFADDRERVACAAKVDARELSPYVTASGSDGCWIESAGRVDLPLLLAGLRRRWTREGRLREEAVEPARELERHRWVIDCRGLAAVRDARLGFLPWEYSKGEVLQVAASNLDPGVILNQRHWVAPIDAGSAWVGATHEPGRCDDAPTGAAREALEGSARRLLERPARVTRHLAGVRVNLPDKLPVLGSHPAELRLGLCNGLGGKGALWAPTLARRWAERVTTGREFPAAWDGGRFAAAAR